MESVALDPYELCENDSGVCWIRFKHISSPHGISTRKGGVSSGPYASLNVGRMSGDSLDLVMENRRLLGAALGFPIPQTLQMDHGCTVALVSDASCSHKGDACVSATPAVPMALTTADCVSLIYEDPVRGVVGLAHAGWRGTALGIAGETVRVMVSLGCSPGDIRVGIGPAILPCCFEVDWDVAEHFPAFRVEAGAKWRVDLHSANLAVLLGAGVPHSNIKACTLCTSCRTDLFYSYRRDRKVTGRMVTAVQLSSRGSSQTFEMKEADGN